MSVNTSILAPNESLGFVPCALREKAFYPEILYIWGV
jgi:hypothetical protein